MTTVKVRDYPDDTDFIKTSPTSGGPPKVHLRENCPHVRKAGRWATKKGRVLFADREVCEWCTNQKPE